jgi:hypothetical protein
VRALINACRAGDRWSCMLLSMTDPNITPRSQAVWSAQLEHADRAEIARMTGVTRHRLARMLTCRSHVTGSQARAIAEAAGMRVVEQGRDAFTMEVGS